MQHTKVTAAPPLTESDRLEPKVRRPAPAPDDVPMVSLGLPVFNGENYLAAALDSILAQTLTDFELIISDNASTDATAEICKSYAERDPRIRYLRQPRNIGAAANYNVVFHAARGRFFKWCAHDDLLGETFLEVCAGRLETQKDDVGAFPKEILVINTRGDLVNRISVGLDVGDVGPGQRFAHYIGLGSVHCGAFFALYRRKMLEGSGLHGAFIGSDRVFIGEMLLRGRISHVDGAEMVFRSHAGSYSASALRDQSKAIAWMDPSKQGARVMRRHRLVAEYFKAITRSSLSLPNRLTAFQSLAGLAWSQRGNLAKELMIPLYRNGRPTNVTLPILRILKLKR